LLIKKYTNQNKKTAELFDQDEEMKVEEGLVKEKSKLIEEALKISRGMEYATDEYIESMRRQA